eukprot:RCo009844
MSMHVRSEFENRNFRGNGGLGEKRYRRRQKGDTPSAAVQVQEQQRQQRIAVEADRESKGRLTKHIGSSGRGHQMICSSKEMEVWKKKMGKRKNMDGNGGWGGGGSSRHALKHNATKEKIEKHKWPSRWNLPHTVGQI